MATISVSLPSDGTAADVSDYNTPITTIVNEINGNLDNANIKSGAAIATSKLADDAGITTAKIAADAVTATKIDWASTGADGGIWWEELGRTTLGSAGDTITVSSLPARRNIKIIFHIIATGGTVTFGLQFNNDTGSNYSYGRAIDGGAISTSASVTTIEPSTAFSTQRFAVVDVCNYASQEKIIAGKVTSPGNAGAAGVISVTEWAGKWANTTDQITVVKCTNGSTGDFAIGSEVIVLGHN